MNSHRASPAKADTNSMARDLLVAKLARQKGIHDLSYLALKTVSATRLLAVCARTGRDPLLDLTQRFACITTAKAFIAFADLCGAYWPESVQVLRPCCRSVSPDEWTLAQLVDHAAHADRDGFGAVLAGFVRQDRHEPLFDRTVELAAHMQ